MKRILPPLAFVVLALLMPSGARGAEEVHAYVGSAKCKPCHQAQYKSWAATKMGKAFELLKPNVGASVKLRSKLDPQKDYTKDTACLPCHTTGHGKPGGFSDFATTPDVAGVGCEECHGPGSAYVKTMMNRRNGKKEFVEAGLVAEITKDQCVNCHNPNTPIGTVVGARHFVKQFVFGKTKGIHEHAKKRK